MNKRLFQTLLILLLATLHFHTPCLAEEITRQDAQVLKPVYRIPLRVHLGDSNRQQMEWIPILEEINTIWLSRAGICFKIHIVDHDEILPNGLDLWFEAIIPEWNGYYFDEHDIHVRDDPDLRPAERPAKSSAARTAAHELGHALKLDHRQDSDDNLMRSKTYGCQLHPDEIKKARVSARQLALQDTTPEHCGPIKPNNQLQ